MLPTKEDKIQMPEGIIFPLMPQHFGCSLSFDGNKILLYGGPDVIGKIVSLSVPEGKKEATIIAPIPMKVNGESEMKLLPGKEIIIKRTDDDYTILFAVVPAPKEPEVTVPVELPTIRIMTAGVVESAAAPAAAPTPAAAPAPEPAPTPAPAPAA
jgi:hypothetical protein